MHTYCIIAWAVSVVILLDIISVLYTSFKAISPNALPTSECRRPGIECIQCSIIRFNTVYRLWC